MENEELTPTIIIRKKNNDYAVFADEVKGDPSKDLWISVVYTRKGEKYEEVIASDQIASITRKS